MRFLSAGLFSRLLLSLLLLTSVASAAHHRRPGPRKAKVVSLDVATPPQPDEYAGATLPATSAAPVELAVPPTFFDDHAALVRHDLLFFKGELSAENTSRRGGPYSLAPNSHPGFVPPPRADDQLELARQHDRVLLLRNQSPSMGSAGIGFAVFGAMTMTSAHAPKFLRFLFDDRVHVGPAMFEGGGMGVGLGGSLSAPASLERRVSP
jgi:hypothetical protein